MSSNQFESGDAFPNPRAGIKFSATESSVESFVTLNEHTLQNTRERSIQIVDRSQTICDEFS